ncbi:MAG TPA: hypothetical protein VHD61_06025 [Lacunisphaera sp.]|nr:hypothetical protein [Lacunisphaera sp.]
MPAHFHLRFPIRPTGFRLRAGLWGLLLGLPLAGWASDWQSLLDNTPFGQAPSAPTAGNPGEPEFRGVVQEDGVYLINLYDPATKKAQWIPVSGKAAGFEVKAYDAGADKVQVSQGGHALTLSLKQAHVTLAAAPAPAANNAPNADNPADQGPPTKEEMEARREQIRDMIRARREARQDGQTPPFMRNMPPEAQAMIEEFRRRRAEAAANRNFNPQGQPAAQRP